MIVRDMFVASDDARVIARAIFEDRCRPQNLYGWITKYYAQLMKLKSAKVRKSDIMFYMSVLVDEDDNDRLYANVSGFYYEDIKDDLTCFLAIEALDYNHYAALYVPDYTVQRYGEEVVAAAALREYGWNGFDKTIVCPDSMRIKILEALDDMKQEIFLIDKHYFDRCRSQFRKSYECKSVPQWDDAKTAEGVKDNRSECSHSLNRMALTER